MGPLPLLVAEALAAEIHVPQDQHTLVDAVAVSASGDVVLIDGGLAPHLDHTATVEILHALTVRGVGPARPTLSGGPGGGELFLLTGDASSLTLEDLDLDGLGADRAVRVQRGSLTLRRVATRGHVGAGGGVLRVEGNAGAVVIEDSQLTDGQTSTDGGLIAIHGGSLTVRRSVLSGGIAAGNGGLVQALAPVSITDSALELGGSGLRGGGLHSVNAALAVDRSRLVGNVANGDRGGGAIYAENSLLTVTDAWFERNTAHGNEGGGALYVRSSGLANTMTRVVFCDNRAAVGDGGAVRVHSGSLSVHNAVLIGNHAESEGGGFYLRNGALPLDHASVVTSSAGAPDAPTSGQAAWSDGLLTITGSYVADHAGAVALFGKQGGDLVVSTTAFSRNDGGDASPAFDSAVAGDPGLPPPKSACEPLELLPPAGSPLLGAGPDGTDIGAFGGPLAWADEDGDGAWSLYDCDDAQVDVNPDADEIPADGVDGNCDGIELCYGDADQDGRGDPAVTVESADTHCLGPGEADNADDLCPIGPDDADADGDGMPDACDPCPLDRADDSDADGVCDSADVCPGHDDALDSDADGVPNGCDECGPEEPDADADGVPDGCDLCPGAPDHVDGDGDGQPDGCDRCPDDPDPACTAEPRDRAPDGGSRVAVAGCGCGGPGNPALGLLWLLAAVIRRRPTSPAPSRRSAPRRAARPGG